MPKLKTKRGAAKRFKLTARGKVKMKRSKLRHMLTNKGAKQRRQFRKGVYASPADEARLRRMLTGA